MKLTSTAATIKLIAVVIKNQLCISVRLYTIMLTFNILYQSNEAILTISIFFTRLATDTTEPKANRSALKLFVLLLT